MSDQDENQIFIEKLARAEEEVAEARSKNSPDLLQKLNYLATFYHIGTNPDRLTEITDEIQALRISQGLLPGPNLVFLALDWCRIGNDKKALEILDRAEKQFIDAKVPRDAVEWEIFLGSKCHLLVGLDRFDEAVVLQRRKVEIIQRTKPEHTDLFESRGYLADILQFKTGDINAAIREREVLLESFRKLIATGPLSFRAMAVYIPNGILLALYYSDSKKGDEAIALLQEISNEVENSPVFGARAIEAPTLLILIAETHHKGGKASIAKKFAARALTSLKQFNHDDPALIARAEALL